MSTPHGLHESSQSRRIAKKMLTRTMANEVVDHEVVTPSAVALVPTVEAQISQIVDHFWTKTQLLAEQNARLQLNQSVQAESQNSAIMAVHANAENNVNQVAQYTRASTEHLQGVMEQTRLAMEEQLQALARHQSEYGQDLHKSLEERIQQVLLEAVAARELAMQHSEETRRIENSMQNALSAMRTELAQRDPAQVSAAQQDISAQLELKWNELQKDMASTIDRIAQDAVSRHAHEAERQLQVNAPATSRVKHIVQKTSTEVEAKLEMKMQSALKQHMLGLKEELNADMNRRGGEQKAELENHLKDTTEAIEQRVQNRMRALLAEARGDLQLQIQRQADQQAQVETRLDSRIDALAAVVEKLQQAAVKQAEPTVTTAELPAQLQTATNNRAETRTPPDKTAASGPCAATPHEALAIAITEATRQITRATEHYEKELRFGGNKNARPQKQRIRGVASDMKKLLATARAIDSEQSKPSKIARIVAQLQSQVKARGEAAAMAYDLRGRKTTK